MYVFQDGILKQYASIILTMMVDSILVWYLTHFPGNGNFSDKILFKFYILFNLNNSKNCFELEIFITVSHDITKMWI